MAFLDRSADPAFRSPFSFPPRFHVLAFLGRSVSTIFGQAFRCADRDLGREVTVYLVAPDHAGRIAGRVRAAQLLNGIPGALHTYDVLQHEVRLFVVQEHAPGGSLEYLLAQRGPLPEARSRAIGVALCAALAGLHDRGLVHGHLTPRTVLLLSPEGDPRLDLVGHPTAIPTSDRNFAPGAVFTWGGSDAPELHAGPRWDGRADLFSLGALLHRMATGSPRPSIPLGDWPGPESAHLSSEFRAIVRRLCDPDPDSRFPTAAACAAALETC